jgi:hypothetical protein
MRFTSLFTALFMMFVTACSMPLAQPMQRALLVEPSEDCLSQLLPAIREVTGLSRIKLSKNPFAKSDTLVLTNHPREHQIPANDPLIGVIGSEKIVRFYKSDKSCFVALLDEQGQIVKRAMLSKCRCKTKEVQ